MNWIIFIPFLILCELIADILAKEYSLKGNWYFWVGAAVAYFVGTLFWLLTIKHGSGLARGAIIFSVGTAIAATIVGVVFYSETTNKIQIIGMVLGALSLALIFWE